MLLQHSEKHSVHHSNVGTSEKHTNNNIQGGRGSAPFTKTAYRVKYFKPKEINQDASTVWT